MQQAFQCLSEWHLHLSLSLCVLLYCVRQNVHFAFPHKHNKVQAERSNANLSAQQYSAHTMKV